MFSQQPGYRALCADGVCGLWYSGSSTVWVALFYGEQPDGKKDSQNIAEKPREGYMILLVIFMGRVCYNTNKGNAYFTWSERARRNADRADKHREQLLAKYGCGYVLILNQQVCSWAKFLTWLPLCDCENAVCYGLSAGVDRKETVRAQYPFKTEESQGSEIRNRVQRTARYIKDRCGNWIGR